MASTKINIKAFFQDHWSDQDRKNVEAVLTLVQNLMNEHNLDLIQKQYSTSNYIQHNRNLKDGIAGVIEYFRTLTKRFPDFSYEVKSVFVDGDKVIVHSHSTVNKKHRGNERKGFNIVDTWRVEDGLPIEHWDAVQPLDTFMRMYYWLTGGKINNKNGLF